MSLRKDQKKSQIQKNINYKNLITQYYNRDNQLKDIKEKIKVDAPEIQILETLNTFDKKLDNLIKTKRYDVQEMFIKPAKKLKRLLRVRFLYEKNTKDNILKIIGGLYPNQQNNSSLKFTSFFRQISFAYFGENLPFEVWKKPISNDKNFSQKDGISIKLPKSNEQTPLVLKFSLICNPPKFNVESSLQKIVGLKRSTRIEVLQAFWEYIKNQKLQDIENKEIINADDRIRNTFKTDKLAFATINNRIRELLTPVEPIVITLKPEESQKVVDFIVQIEERPDFDIVPFFAQKLNEQKNDHPYLSINGKIKKFDKKYQDHAEKLRRHLAKRQVYKNFTPQYIETIIQEQNELLKVLKKSHPIEDHNKLEFILENEEQVEKEIKHYYEQLNIGSGQQRSE